jgi:hypothetical protein
MARDSKGKKGGAQQTSLQSHRYISAVRIEKDEESREPAGRRGIAK